MKLKMLTALTLSAALLATVHGQQRGAAAAASTAVPALDYFEIQQVYAHLSHALDSAEDNGNAFAALFTPDGVFVTAAGTRYAGHDQLAAFAREDPDKRKGPTNVGHYVTNVAIDATAAGARGHGYLLEATQLPPAPAAGRGRGGPVRAVTEGGAFWDDLVRTADGWRIKSRTLVRPNGPVPASATSASASSAAAPATMAHPFTAQDYADITQLFALFGYGFDSGADNGYQWASLYTPDGVFVNGTVIGAMKGRDTLAAFAAGRLNFAGGLSSLTLGPGPTHNPLAIAHILTDVAIDPAPEGAVARAYRLNANIGNDGRPALAPGGLYHVLLARTSEGWRFKENWYAGPGAPVQDAVKRFMPTRGEAPAAAAAAAPGGAAAPILAVRGAIPPLTIAADDDAAIRQLYARFSHAIDSGADNGAALARLFTSDGVFLDTWTNKVYTGTDQIAALARTPSSTGPKGPTTLNQFIWTVRIDAAPQGASAKGYMMTGSVQEPGKPIVMTNGGQYWDDLVKTADGWRIKKRTFYRSTQTPPPMQTAAN